ncbi:MAG: phosphopyruvate hydratase [Chloroflexota bacterium]
MSKIDHVSAVEILDSRGRPTLMVSCKLNDGTLTHASVPSGASTGGAEALELRDGDPNRYAGLGCLKAVGNVNTIINDALADKTFTSQADLDRALIDVDGTENKSRLGANAVLGVSLAFCRAQAAAQNKPLFQHIATLAETTPHLPRPMINLYSGGKHGGGQTEIQDVQIVSPVAGSIRRTLEVMSDVFRAAVALAAEQHSMRLLTADEGGLAPPFQKTEAMFAAAVTAIERAGYTPGSQVALTVDVAASHFYEAPHYHIDDQHITNTEMVSRISTWCRDYPIISVEDGLSDEDWSGWQVLYGNLANAVMVLGDDLLCTNPVRIRRAVEEKAANSLLLKVNQIGTLSEAIDAYQLARQAGWQVVVSARSGETEDDWLADLATGLSGDYIKVGSITQSERLAKYNRLLFLEHYHGLSLKAEGTTND